MEKQVSNGRLRQVRVTFMLIYLLYMSARSLFNPYVTLFLHEKGFDAGVIGNITAANSFVLIFAQPFWGLISDAMRSVKKTIIICMVLQAAVAQLMRDAAAVVMVTVMYCVFGFFSSPEGPLLDTWSLHSLKQAGDAHGVGQLKLFGCLGYSLCSVFSALAIARSTTASMLPIYAAVLVVTAMILMLIPEGAPKEKAAKLKDLNPASMLRNTAFVSLLIYIFFMQIPHRAAYTFYATYITELGGTKAMVGFTNAVMFLSEGLVLYFSKKLLAKYPPQYVILGSSLCFALWQVLYAMAPSAPWIVGIAVLDGPSYGLFCIGMLYYLDVLAPGKLRASYQTIAYAVYFGLAGIAGNKLAGVLIESLGYRPMYWLGTALILASSLVYWLANRKTWQREREAH